MSSSTTRLLKYLGPFADESAVPDAVERRTLHVPPSDDDARPMQARVYAPIDAPPSGAYLIAHGLHFLGPDDPRMDRFLRVLAHAGFLVVCPILPSYTSLTVDERVTSELERGLSLLERINTCPRDVLPGIFSISFGSLPAYRLAARPDAAARIGALVVFGGYVDFARTLAFALGAREGAAYAPERDPLNLPVVVMNLLAAMTDLPCDPSLVVPSWQRYVCATWGRPEMKEPARYNAVADEVARDIVDDDARQLFLLGCGVREGARELCERALERVDARPFDPKDAIIGARVPIHAIHGVDDDVIPYTELARLAALAPLSSSPITTSLTGLFAHTGKSRATSIGERVSVGAREARTLLAMVRALVDSGRHRRA